MDPINPAGDLYKPLRCVSSPVIKSQHLPGPWRPRRGFVAPLFHQGGRRPPRPGTRQDGSDQALHGDHDAAFRMGVPARPRQSSNGSSATSWLFRSACPACSDARGSWRGRRCRASSPHALRLLPSRAVGTGVAFHVPAGPARLAVQDRGHVRGGIPARPRERPERRLLDACISRRGRSGGGRCTCSASPRSCRSPSRPGCGRRRSAGRAGFRSSGPRCSGGAGGWRRSTAKPPPRRRARRTARIPARSRIHSGTFTESSRSVAQYDRKRDRPQLMARRPATSGVVGGVAM